MSKIFPSKEISVLAEKESWRKEINRPIYHIHKYWAQRLGSVFRSLLIYLLDSNDTWDEFYKVHNYKDKIVLDPFMGSGTTIGEAAKLGAKAIGSDINPISSFLVRQELTKVQLKELKRAYSDVEKKVSNKIMSFYETTDPESGARIPVLYYFWVKIATTPEGEKIPLFSRYVFAQNAYPSKKPEANIICPTCQNIIHDRYDTKKCVCPNCKTEFNPQEGPAKRTTVKSPTTGKEYIIKDLLPKNGRFEEQMYALLAYRKDGSKVYLPITDNDRNLYKEAAIELKKTNFLPIPNYGVEPGYNTDQARGYGYTQWEHFFNDRQKLCLALLLNSILEVERADIREQLLCLFSSTLEFNNMFCSYKGEGTGAVRPIFSNHILKPERTPLENSVWGFKGSSGCFSTLYKSRLLKAKEYLDSPFELKIEGQDTLKVIASENIEVKIVNSYQELVDNEHSVMILNGDSSQLPIPDGSVDCVVTDPPYFDFIHYSELSDFFYAWLSPVLKGTYSYFIPTTSRRENEVQQTDSDLFANLLGNVFHESFRATKDEGTLSFSFHHSRIDGWVAITQAISQSGFYIRETIPVHAELMASTPKSEAKEPISLDAMIICDKVGNQLSDEDIFEEIEKAEAKAIEIGKKLSKGDIFVIVASKAIIKCVNQRFNKEESSKYIKEMLLRVKETQ